MNNRPFTFQVLDPKACCSENDNHIIRHLSALKGQFHDRMAFHDALNMADMLIYEVYENRRPEVPGELIFGVSVIHPGKVGDEFFMTKGHFHSVLETAELYYCLMGEGVLVMETPEGEWAVEELNPGSITYVPPRWAHRSVNTSLDDPLFLFFVYPAHAGHDYESIEEYGFRKLIFDCGDTYEIVNNPRWSPPERR